MDANIVKQLNPGMGLGFGFVLLEIAGGAGFCVRAARDRIFCVRDANTVHDANSRMPLLFCVVLLESVSYNFKDRNPNTHG